MEKIRIGREGKERKGNKREIKKEKNIRNEKKVRENVGKTAMERVGIEPTSTKCKSLASSPINHSSISPKGSET